MAVGDDHRSGRVGAAEARHHRERQEQRNLGDKNQVTHACEPSDTVTFGYDERGQRGAAQRMGDGTPRHQPSWWCSPPCADASAAR